MPIMNLLLLGIIIAVQVVWIIALVNYDGKCHYDDCDTCPYHDGCPQEGEKNDT